MGYIGGKSKISKFIIPKIPTDIEVLVEVFGGMMWNYLKMDLKKYPKLKKVIYNDFNGLNANLFKCAKDYHQMYETLIKYPFQKFGEYPTPPEHEQNFKRWQKEIFDPRLKIGSEPDFHIASKYVLVLSQCFSGSNPVTSSFVDLKGKYHCKSKSFLNKMKNPYYQEHLEKISIVENMDFGKLIDKYDSLNTFFYVDPPYFQKEHLYANHNFFGIDEHLRLSTKLETILGKFALSYYRFPELDSLYDPDFFKYYEQKFKKDGQARKGKETSIGTEILIINY